MPAAPWCSPLYKLSGPKCYFTTVIKPVYVYPVSRKELHNLFYNKTNLSNTLTVNGIPTSKDLDREYFAFPLPTLRFASGASECKILIENDSRGNGLAKN